MVRIPGYTILSRYSLLYPRYTFHEPEIPRISFYLLVYTVYHRPLSRLWAVHRVNESLGLAVYDGHTSLRTVDYKALFWESNKLHVLYWLTVVTTSSCSLQRGGLRCDIKRSRERVATLQQAPRRASLASQRPRLSQVHTTHTLLRTREDGL